MSDAFLMTLAGAALIVVPAALFAAVIRKARLFGPGGDVAAAVVGGVLWGMVVGPGVMGRTWIGVHERLYVGGETQRETLRRLVRDQAIELAVLKSSGATEEAVTEQRVRHAAERQPSERAVRAALESHERRWNRLIVGLAATCVALAILLRAGARPRCPGSDGRAALIAGLVASLVPALAGAVGLAVGTGSSWGTSAAFGAAVGAGWIIPSVRARWSGREGRRASLDASAIVASSLGLLAIGVIGRSVWAAVAGTAAWFAWRQAGRRWRRPFTRCMRFGLYSIAAPGLIAAIAARVDPYKVLGLGAFWIAAGVAIVVGGDGRWTCVFGVWRWARRGEHWRRAADRASAYTLSGVGFAQCLGAGVLASTGALRESDVGALLLGATCVECAAGLYRAVSRPFSNSQREGDASLVDEPGEGELPS